MKVPFTYVDKAILDMARIVNLFSSNPEILEGIEIELIGSKGKKVNVLVCGFAKLQVVIEDMTVYMGFSDIVFENECLPTIEGVSFEVNMLTKDHKQITHDLRKRFAITYESRYRSALQRLLENLQAGRVQTPGFWKKFLLKRSMRFTTQSSIIDRMIQFTPMEIDGSQNRVIKLDLPETIKGVGTYYAEIKDEFVLTDGNASPNKLGENVISIAMNKFIL